MYRIWIIALVVLMLGSSACSPDLPSGSSSAEAPTTAAEDWASLFQRTPYPYTRELPPEPSLIDGTYTKVDLKQGTPVPCRRCPEYAPESGVWKLSFEHGIFRINQTVTGWKSIASFSLSGDRLLIFNDPNCVDTVGEYLWKLEDDQLSLTEIRDSCAIHLRAVTLTQQPWSSCQPPTLEAGISDHWVKPTGCD